MSVTHYDVLIVGAGLSGIGTARHVAAESPDKSLAIFERRERIGGTWDLFRYPGIRSDSDMLSFGYEGRLWTDPKVLADAAALRSYIEAAAREAGIAERIHFGLKVTSADWSSVERRWKISAVHEVTGELQAYSCSFLIASTGYYNHDAGFRPEFRGEHQFGGAVFHAQHWPEHLDYSGKKVVVIGSGATAATVVPAIAGTAAHVTMLQRSPSYYFSLPGQDHFAGRLARIIPANWAYGLARWRNIKLQRTMYVACRRWPTFMRRLLLSQVRKHVGPNVDIRHFKPRYMPWDERLCVVPDADLFKAIRSGTASVETDQIDTFTAKGLRLSSGKEIEADIVVVATGLSMQMLGGLALSVDGVPHSLADRVTYKGVLIEGIPNLAWIFGYINQPWTLKMDAAATYLCRLFKYMQLRQLEIVTPRDTESSALKTGILDGLQSGYVRRDGHIWPRQGRTYPWKVEMYYPSDKKMLLEDPVADSRLRFVAARAVAFTDVGVQSTLQSA